MLTSVGLAVLEAIGRPGFLEHVAECGEQFARGLAQLERHFPIAETRGVGLLHAIELERPVAETLRDHAMDLGLLVNAAQPNVVRMAPSLRIAHEELETGLELLEQALRRCFADLATRAPLGDQRGAATRVEV